MFPVGDKRLCYERRCKSFIASCLCYPSVTRCSKLNSLDSPVKRHRFLFNKSLKLRYGCYFFTTLPQYLKEVPLFVIVTCRTIASDESIGSIYLLDMRCPESSNSVYPFLNRYGKTFGSVLLLTFPVYTFIPSRNAGPTLITNVFWKLPNGEVSTLPKFSVSISVSSMPIRSVKKYLSPKKNGRENVPIL